MIDVSLILTSFIICRTLGTVQQHLRDALSGIAQSFSELDHIMYIAESQDSGKLAIND